MLTITSFQWWRKNHTKWLLFTFVGSLLFTFQELVNKTRFSVNIVGGIQYVQLASDNVFNPVVSSLFLWVLMSFELTDWISKDNWLIWLNFLIESKYS
jgi:hypothetical protein